MKNVKEYFEDVIAFPAGTKPGQELSFEHRKVSVALSTDWLPTVTSPEDRIVYGPGETAAAD